MLTWPCRSGQCRLLGITRSGVYRPAPANDDGDLALMRRIDAVFLAWPFLGPRRMTAMLRADGLTINRKRVQQRMRVMGIAALGPKPRTTRPAPGHRIIPYLLRDLVIDRANEVWAADITYVPNGRGFLYVVAVIDWASRAVRAWRLSNTMDVAFCVDALDDDGVAVPLVIPRQKGQTQLAIKDVTIDRRRYVLCRNQEEAEKDAEARTAILASLERKLAQGDKALVGNAGFRRFLGSPKGEGFTIDPAKVEADARFDGLFVLRTNTKLSALQVVLRYRNLLAVEDAFKTTKALLATRPIFHKTDAAIRGHVFVSFLALMLRKELIDRLAARRSGALEWQRIIDDLADLSAVEVEQDGRRALLRTAPGPTIDPLCRALGLTLPPVFQELPRTENSPETAEACGA